MIGIKFKENFFDFIYKNTWSGLDSTQILGSLPVTHFTKLSRQSGWMSLRNLLNSRPAHFCFVSGFEAYKLCNTAVSKFSNNKHLQQSVLWSFSLLQYSYVGCNALWICVCWLVNWTTRSWNPSHRAAKPRQTDDSLPESKRWQSNYLEFYRSCGIFSTCRIETWSVCALLLWWNNLTIRTIDVPRIQTHRASAQQGSE